jgi:hypothetical protein
MNSRRVIITSSAATSDGGKTLALPIRAARRAPSYFTFFCIHSSRSLAISRLFFSIITMCPLPLMP